MDRLTFIVEDNPWKTLNSINENKWDVHRAI